MVGESDIRTGIEGHGGGNEIGSNVGCYPNRLDLLPISFELTCLSIEPCVPMELAFIFAADDSPYSRSRLQVFSSEH